MRNTRVLARHAYRYVRSRGVAPQGLPEAVADLAEAAHVWALAAAGESRDEGQEVRALGRSAARQATEVSERHPDYAVAGIAAQVRSIAVDLIRASAPDRPEAPNTPPPVERPTEELLIRPDATPPLRPSGAPPPER